MYDLKINPDWTFKDIVNNLETLKLQYEGVLASFYYFDLHEVVDFKRKIRNAIYELNFQEWKKDKIWNYMNGFEFLYVLKGIVQRETKCEK